MRRVISEIKKALPVRAAIPIYPRGKGERIALRHVRRQLDVTVRAVQRNGLADLPGHIIRIGHRKAVVAVTGTVQRVRLEMELRDAPAAARRPDLCVSHLRRQIHVSHAGGSQSATTTASSQLEVGASGSTPV